MTSIKYFYNPPAQINNDLIIRGIGHQEIMKPCHVRRPQGTDDYLFMYYPQPTQISALNQADESLPLHPAGSAILWTPQTPQHYGLNHSNWSHSWIHFKGRLADRLVKRERLACNQIFAFPNPADLEQTLFMLYRALKQSSPDTEIALALFKIFTRHVHRALHQNTQPPQPPQAYLEVKHLLETQLDQHFYLDELAGRVNHSPPYFSEQFKKHFGMAPMKYQMDQRLQHACYLLQDVNLNITQVAQRVGYDDLFHFSKLFKKRFQQSPRAYRQSIQAQG